MDEDVKTVEKAMAMTLRHIMDAVTSLHGRFPTKLSIYPPFVPLHVLHPAESLRTLLSNVKIHPVSTIVLNSFDNLNRIYTFDCLEACLPYNNAICKLWSLSITCGDFWWLIQKSS